MLDDISIYDFVNSKYRADDYMESFIITMGILLIVYMFVISRSEPTMVLVITFALVFVFLVVVQKKYKEKYNDKLKIVKRQVNIIKQRLNMPITDINDDELMNRDEEIEDDNPIKKYKKNAKKIINNNNESDNQYNPISNLIKQNKKIVPIKPTSTPTDKKSLCNIGTKSINELENYKKNGCDLFKNNNECLTKCASKQLCGYLVSDEEGGHKMECRNCDNPDHAFLKTDGTINKTTNCNNPPDKLGGGFGCPGLTPGTTAKPIEADTSNNYRVCEHDPK
jgi:Ca2+/Na+ antiporter